MRARQQSRLGTPFRHSNGVGVVPLRPLVARNSCRRHHSQTHRDRSQQPIALRGCGPREVAAMTSACDSYYQEQPLSDTSDNGRPRPIHVSGNFRLPRLTPSSFASNVISPLCFAFFFRFFLGGALTRCPGAVRPEVRHVLLSTRRGRCSVVGGRCGTRGRRTIRRGRFTTR